MINIVRRSNSLNSPTSEAHFSFDPLSEKVSQHINEYIKNRKKTMNSFFAFMHNPQDVEENERVAWANIGNYCQRHKGLVLLLFIFKLCFRIRSITFFLC